MWFHPMFPAAAYDPETLGVGSRKIDARPELYLGGDVARRLYHPWGSA